MSTADPVNIVGAEKERIILKMKRSRGEEEFRIEPPAKRSKQFISQVVDSLQCPVCINPPRNGPIYNCQNGHYVCGKCRSRLSMCPVCRSRQMNCRNLLMEQILDEALKQTTGPCKFREHGCQVDMKLNVIESHEDVCKYRVVKCPAHGQKACLWEGPLTQITDHFRKHKCIVPIRGYERDGCFEYSSTVGNFVNENIDVFNFQSGIFWKPIVLCSSENFHLLPHLKVIRLPDGTWTFVVKAFAPKQVLEKYRVKITVSSGEGKEVFRTFSFQGNIVSDDVPPKDYKLSPDLLVLTDSQVKTLSKDRKRLLKCTVQITNV